MFTQWYKGGNVAAVPQGLFMTVGAIPTGNGYGTCYGYTSDPHYLQMGDGGDLSYKFLRDIRDPANPKIVRIADIVMQQGTYLVLGWEPIAGVPDPSWPPFTWKMMLNNGTIYNFEGGGIPSISPPCQARYLSAGNAGLTAAAVGQQFSVAFV